MNNVIGGVGKSQLTACFTKIATIEVFPEPDIATWGISGVVTNCKPNEDTINQDEITVYRAIK